MDASYKIQRGIHVHLIQFFMCPEFWVHINMRPLLHPFRVEGGTYPVPSSHLAFISEQPQGIGGKLLVGLLTNVSRRA